MITVLVLNQSLETARLCLEDVHCFFAREEIIILLSIFCMVLLRTVIQLDK